MSSVRAVVSAVLAWLVVVAVGSTVVWLVISRAGDGIEPATAPEIASGSTQPGTSQRATERGTATPSPARPGPTGPGSTAPGATEPGTTEPGTTEPEVPEPETSEQDPTPPATDRPPTGHSTSGTVAQRRTWQGTGGLVTVECRGERISLVATSADAGFVVEPELRGPEEVRVSFEGQGEEGHDSSVEAHCEHGTPAFEAETNDD